VEMAGVEPASEEKAIKTTPYIVCLSHLVGLNPTDRTLDRQPRRAPVPRSSPGSIEERAGLSRLSRRLVGTRQEEFQEAGYLIT
jgi:hypothetical protein